MNGNKIVADTSVLINFFGGDRTIRNVLEDRHIWVSSITEIELLCYRELTDDEDKLIRDFLGECSIVDLIKPVREIAINVRKEHNLKIPDAIIAATSIHLNFPLFTLDSDFKKIDDFNVIYVE
jgi:predicted nucleic acid-binding protein